MDGDLLAIAGAASFALLSATLWVVTSRRVERNDPRQQPTRVSAEEPANVSPANVRPLGDAPWDAIVAMIEALVRGGRYGTAVDLCDGMLATRGITEDVELLMRVMSFQEEADTLQRGAGGIEYRRAWSWLHPKEFQGQVWVAVSCDPQFVGAEYNLVIQWGPLVRVVELKPMDTSPIYLIHQKIQPDAVSLLVRSNYSCHISFGTKDSPPDFPAVDVNDGWVLTKEALFRGHIT